MLTVWEIVLGGPALFLMGFSLYAILFGLIYIATVTVPQWLCREKN